jgi:iron:rusticyanin reductase
MKRVVLALALLAARVTLTPSIAHATPAFARQTGGSCQACHTVFSELTPFGRKFKLNAYVFTNVKQLEPISEQGQRTLALSEIPPLRIQLQGSNTALSKSVPDAGVTP